jgi:non-ribosomal peptide synthetase component F
MAIQLTGSVYCPLSPRDPQHRLSELIQQTQTGLVLIHSNTTSKFTSDTLTLNIDTALINNTITRETEIDVDRLSEMKVTPDDISYVIFTSGSTGTPKAVSDHDIFYMSEMTSLVLGSSATSKFHSVNAFICSHSFIQ